MILSWKMKLVSEPWHLTKSHASVFNTFNAYFLSTYYVQHYSREWDTADNQTDNTQPHGHFMPKWGDTQQINNRSSGGDKCYQEK